MKKFTLFSVGGIALAILIVFLTTGAKSNTTLPESTVSETVVADTTAVTETEKAPETTVTTTTEPAETETAPTTEMTNRPKGKRNYCACCQNQHDQNRANAGRTRFDHR